MTTQDADRFTDWVVGIMRTADPDEAGGEAPGFCVRYVGDDFAPAVARDDLLLVDSRRLELTDDPLVSVVDLEAESHFVRRLQRAESGWALVAPGWEPVPLSDRHLVLGAVTNVYKDTGYRPPE